MLRRRKIVSDKKSDILEDIKKDLQMQLGEKGIGISGVDMQMKSENLSLSIFLKSNRRWA
jgi:hypothetical protein